MVSVGGGGGADALVALGEEALASAAEPGLVGKIGCVLLAGTGRCGNGDRQITRMLDGRTRAR